MTSSLTDAQLRKIGPVYDALDNRQFKQAIKLADKYLEKYPKQTMGLVLKAYAMIMLPEASGKEEARKILAGVKAGPAITCSDTLQVLSSCLRLLKGAAHFIALDSTRHHSWRRMTCAIIPSLILSDTGIIILDF